MDALLTSFEDAWTSAPEQNKPPVTHAHRRKMAGTAIRPWTPQLLPISESLPPVPSPDVQFTSDDPRNPRNKNVTPGPSASSLPSAHLPSAVPTPSASAPKPTTVKPISPCKTSNTPSTLLPKSQLVKPLSAPTPPAAPRAKPNTPSAVKPTSPAVKHVSTPTIPPPQCPRKPNTPSAVKPTSPAVKLVSTPTIPPPQCPRKPNTPAEVKPTSPAVKHNSSSKIPPTQCAKSPHAKSTPSSKQSSTPQSKPRTSQIRTANNAPLVSRPKKNTPKATTDAPSTKPPAPAPGKPATTWKIPKKRKSPSELFLDLGLDLPDLLSPLNSPIPAPPPSSNELPPAKTPPFSSPPIPEHAATPSTAESPATPGTSMAAPLEPEPLPIYAAPFQTSFPTLSHYPQSAQFLYALSSLLGPLHYSPAQPEYFPSLQPTPLPEPWVQPYTPTPLTASIPVHTGFSGPTRTSRRAGKRVQRKRQRYATSSTP
nr:PREDICTED: extensin-like [Bemisia tabaci]